MQYMIQAFLGSFLTPQDITHEDILIKIRKVLNTISIKTLIIGWHNDPVLYEKIISLAHHYGTEVFLWLPIFSEVNEIILGMPAIDYNQNSHKSISVMPNEDFSFSCPSNPQNLTRIHELYQQNYMNIPFDGIFMDKIRYSTFANGFESAIGCFCPTCQNIYKSKGIDIEKCLKLIKQNPHLLYPIATDGMYLKFSDNFINKLYKVRVDIISQSIINMIKYFRKHKLKIGLDVFSPFLAYYVGQDIPLLSQYTDFIKPMIYQITNAPAGIPFEEECWNKEFEKHTGKTRSLCKLWNLDNLTSLIAFSRQHTLLQEYSQCPIYSGIEINFKKNICNPNHQYITERLEYIDTNKQEGVVLSWDILGETCIDSVFEYNRGRL